MYNAPQGKLSWHISNNEHGYEETLETVNSAVPNNVWSHLTAVFGCTPPPTASLFIKNSQVGLLEFKKNLSYPNGHGPSVMGAKFQIHGHDDIAQCDLSVCQLKIFKEKLAIDQVAILHRCK